MSSALHPLPHGIAADRGEERAMRGIHASGTHDSEHVCAVLMFRLIGKMP
jgi:hypothetical protein